MGGWSYRVCEVEVKCGYGLLGSAVRQGAKSPGEFADVSGRSIGARNPRFETIDFMESASWMIARRRTAGADSLYHGGLRAFFRWGRWEKETYDAAQAEQTKERDKLHPDAGLMPSVEGKSIAEQARALLEGRAKWKPTWVDYGGALGTVERGVAPGGR